MLSAIVCSLPTLTQSLQPLPQVLPQSLSTCILIFGDISVLSCWECRQLQRCMRVAELHVCTQSRQIFAFFDFHSITPRAYIRRTFCAMLSLWAGVHVVYTCQTSPLAEADRSRPTSPIWPIRQKIYCLLFGLRADQLSSNKVWALY